MNKLKKLTLKQTYPFIMVITGSIGFIASFMLTIDLLEILKNPNFQPVCNINPIFSCSSVMESSASSTFGFANPLIGIAGYAAIITIGMALIAGATFKRWFWIGLQIGTTLAMPFLIWLFYYSLYDSKALCLFCMTVWAVTLPLFWYTTLYNFREKNINISPKLNKFLQKHHGDILLVLYLIPVVLILNRFWYYWSTLI